MIVVALMLCAPFPMGATPTEPVDAAAVYQANCAICHEHPETKAPPIATLHKLSAQRIHQTLEFGIMQPMAAHLTAEQRKAVVKWLAAAEDAQRYAWIEKVACRGETPAVLTGRENWGMGRDNWRNPGDVRIGADNVQRLELKWSLAVPAVGTMRSLPVVAGETIFLGGADARLYALDRRSGCVRWHLEVDAAIRNALTLERTPDGVNTLYFADELGTVYAVDATRGKLRWRTSVKTHPTSIVSGSIAFHQGRIFVPISLFEIMVAANPQYECCRAHGGVTALDATTGTVVWRFATTEDARPTSRSSVGTQLWGPAGAAVWNRPTVDVERGALYFGTGENSASPPTATSDSIIAVDLATGRQRWVFQALANDAWNLSCNMRGPNCPKENGPDFDFGASPILVHDGRGKRKGDLILAGQKSGEVFALDPDPGGAVVWRHHFTPTAVHFNANAGIHHGMATDGERLIVPIADSEHGSPGHVPQPGVHAVSVADGKILWSHRFERGCTFDPADKPGAGAGGKAVDAERSPWPACSFFYAPSAPPTLANGLAYVSTLDGKVHVFDAATGKRLHVVETNRDYAGSNGVEGHGGAIDVGGALVAGDQLVVSSGYAMFGQMPGNMLLVYGLPD
jgi:polyvinyl alcohol dehydrogenase (cytochrome)